MKIVNFLMGMLFVTSFSFAQDSPVGFVAYAGDGYGEVFLACGPNQVGANNIIYKLFYSKTSEAPADPITATEYTFGTTAGDGSGVNPFGFHLTGLDGGTSYTFWLYQYNTVDLTYSSPAIKAVTTNGGTSGDDPIYDYLVWSDEFETDGAVNSGKWFHQTQLPSGNSWYNGEIQHYTNRIDNTYVEDGVMYLVAKNETFTDQGVTKNYTSARLNSKFAFTYGRVEVRAKLPAGVGTWPAIWTLGKNINEVGAYWYNQGYGTTSWPNCGEIDIMEHWGTNQNFVQSALHTPSSYGGTVNHGGQVISTASTAFHVYALDWYEDRMVFSVDDVVHYVYQPGIQNDATWPFYQDQYILLNIAILPSIQASFSQTSMEIDYVRVYQEDTGLSLPNLTQTEITIYPNPINDVCNIKIPQELIGSEIEIYNIQGQLIDSFQACETNMQINASSWKSGVYLLKQSNDSFNKRYKLIKR